MKRLEDLPPMFSQDAQHPRQVRTLVARIRPAQILAVLLMVATSATAATAASPPSFDMVIRTLTDYFKSQSDFRRGDLLNQQQVTEALQAVADKAGWKVPDADKIAELALPVNSFLVGELATPDGKRFMRKIAASPGTYSRLDRLSQISQGQQVVSQLIGDVGGDTFITYLATTNSGHNLGQMLAGAQQGSDLNLPTGRIYTADDLLAALKKAYAKEFGTR
jgi:hypothetical protein